MLFVVSDAWREAYPGASAGILVMRDAAYNAHYKRFGQTYHVQLQLESVALKGREIPDVAALVEAMFVAELKNLLLTAGHDLATIVPPITLDVATGEEAFTRLNGRPTTATRGDMLMVDKRGVISTVLQGPDDRTAITPETRDVVFAVYAPEGIAAAAVRSHLEDIAANVGLVSPKARVESLDVCTAEPV